MQPFTSSSISYDGEDLKILDQTLLPHREEWISCNDVPTLVEIIQRLAIRGAPAIGIAASLLLALRAESGSNKEQLQLDITTLQAARPTAVNIINYTRRILSQTTCPSFPDSVVKEAENIYQEDILLCKKMSQLGSQIINKNDRLLTHCNTGSLATAGTGTAFGVINHAHEQGKNIFLWVDETRPLLQGGRLTAWECLQKGIPHKIICDSSAALIMQQGKVDKIFVGSDRIATNGDFANKIGTYSLAVIAKYHKIPFYVVAPRTTIDPHCANGKDISIEEREDTEVRGFADSTGSCQWSPSESSVYNPAFDITPAHLVTSWILDSGVFTQKDLVQTEWWNPKET